MPVLVAGGSTLLNRSTAVIIVTRPADNPLSTVRTSQSPQYPTVEPAPSNTQAITDNGGTQVGHVGSGAYSIEKISGAVDTFDAGAVSSVGIANEFVLRLKYISGSRQAMGGMNSDPLADNASGSIDFAALYFGGGWTIYESGVNPPGATSGLADSTYFWIWRSGTAIGYGRGATLATAQAAPDRTTTSSATLYFDSSIDRLGDKFEALLYLPQDMAATSALSFAPSGAESANATLASSSPLAFASPTAQLRGDITAVGAAAITFTPAGAETAKGSLAGTSPLAFTPSGVETAAGVLASTAPLTFSASGQTTAVGTLSGASTAQFTPTASLLAAGVLAGGSTLALTPTGSTTAVGALAGDGPLTFTGNATVTASAFVIASSGVVFDTSAAISASIFDAGALLRGRRRRRGAFSDYGTWRG